MYNFGIHTKIKIEFIKMLREKYGFSLQESKDLAEWALEETQQHFLNLSEKYKQKTIDAIDVLVRVNK